jgi:phosphoglucomutase
MTVSPLAGRPAPRQMLVDPACLEREYFQHRPELDDPQQQISFGTSGHRGSSLRGSFTEAHILAITQAICDFRRMQGTNGPLFMGRDTHALSAPCYLRIDAPATAQQMARLKSLSPESVRASSLAGEPIIARLGRAPSNDAAIDGVNIMSASGWFAARPSGAEAVYKIYAESFRGEARVNAIAREAQAIMNAALAEPSVPSQPSPERR